MRSRFVDYPGFYALHCHILAHEDCGMMTVVSVHPVGPPFQHHCGQAGSYAPARTSRAA
jgi:hypothetical protein